MQYNLDAIRSFGFWSNIRTMLRTVKAVLGKLEQTRVSA